MEDEKNEKFRNLGQVRAEFIAKFGEIHNGIQQQAPGWKWPSRLAAPPRIQKSEIRQAVSKHGWKQPTEDVILQTASHVGSWLVDPLPKQIRWLFFLIAHPTPPTTKNLRFFFVVFMRCVSATAANWERNYLEKSDVPRKKIGDSWRICSQILLKVRTIILVTNQDTTWYNTVSTIQSRKSQDPKTCFGTSTFYGLLRCELLYCRWHSH